MSIPVFRRMRRTMNKQTPLHRSCTRNEVAETVQWLATKAQGMTGKIMYVDAGYNTTVSVCYPRDWADTAFP
jgi:enoyl-[acyl-carrier-protein] reductase (NADH)